MIRDTFTGTSTVFLVGQNSNFPKSTSGQHTMQFQELQHHRHATCWVWAFCTCVSTCEGVRRGTRVSKLTSFHAHVSLKHLPCCLAKFRAWPTGLTWQGKHKPGDELSAQTRYQICVLRFKRRHGMSAALVPEAAESDDAHETSWCHMLPAVIFFSNPLNCAVENQILHLKIIWEVMKWIGLYPRLLKLHQSRSRNK